MKLLSYVFGTICALSMTGFDLAAEEGNLLEQFGLFAISGLLCAVFYALSDWKGLK